MIQPSSESQSPKILFFCSCVVQGTIPLVLGTLIIILEVTSLPSVHPQNCMPATSCVMENKWIISPQVDCRPRNLLTLPLDLGPSSFTVTFLSHHCAYPAGALSFFWWHAQKQPTTALSDSLGTRGSISRKLDKPYLLTAE